MGLAKCNGEHMAFFLGGMNGDAGIQAGGTEYRWRSPIGQKGTAFDDERLFGEGHPEIFASALRVVHDAGHLDDFSVEPERLADQAG